MEVALAVAGVVYGALLGAFLLAVLTRRPGQLAVIAGMTTGLAAVVWAWLEGAVGWTWYVPLGGAVTFAVGWLVGRMAEIVKQRDGRSAAGAAR